MRLLDRLAKEGKTPLQQKTILCRLIIDAHLRIASNRDQNYRIAQQLKIDEWTEDLTKLYDSGAISLALPELDVLDQWEPPEPAA